MKTILDPRKRAPRWQEENWAERIDLCRVALVSHGLLSGSESEKVRARIIKWIKRYEEEMK